jgi:phosphohistidine phosphatase
MRHGQAEPPSNQVSDRDRKLTPYGEAQVFRMAQWMKTLGVTPDRILASPFHRTRQTATLMCQGLGVSAEDIVFDELLISGSEPELAAAWILTHAAPNVLVVSHMPLVAQLTLHFAPGAVVERFPPASVARIEYQMEVRHGILLAHVAPEELE